MARSPLPPLDPKIARLLRTTEFAAPPIGAKGRVRSQLVLAGIVTAIRPAGAGTASAPTVSPSPHLQTSGWRTAVDTARSGAAKIVARPALLLTAGIALGAAGALFTARPAAQPFQNVREEMPRAQPNALVDTTAHETLDTAASTSSARTPRSAPSVVKKPSTPESLGLEQRLLAIARASLGRGDLEAAAQELDRHARLFPNGHLSEEREALRILTLAQQGNLTAARERAARFRRTYPRSIQMSTVDGAVGERP